MAFDFPSSPTLGQTFTPSGGPTFSWNGYAWDLVIAATANITLEVSLTADQTSGVVTNGYSICKYNSKIIDVQSAYDTSTGIFTPKVAGVYFVSASIGLWLGSSATWVGIAIMKNGATTVGQTQANRIAVGSAGIYAPITVSALVYCNGSTDTIAAVGLHNDTVFKAGANLTAPACAINMVAVLMGSGPPGAAGATGPQGPAGASGAAGEFTTGDVKLTLKNVADAGWLMFDDGSIGDVGSGSTFANATAFSLFQLLFYNTGDADCPIQTSAGAATTRAAQGSHATAWANKCRMVLPKVLGRALAGAGSGAGLSAWGLGQSGGVETNTATVTFTLNTGQLPQHAHPCPQGINFVAAWGSGFGVAAGADYLFNGYATTDYAGSTQPVSIGSPAFSVQNPRVSLNVMVKL